MRGVRAIAAKAHVSVDEARRELLEGRIDEDEQINEAAHVRPAWQLETQVVALRDDDAVDLDGQGGGDGLVQVAPVIGARTTPSARRTRPRRATYPPTSKVSGAPL